MLIHHGGCVLDTVCHDSRDIVRFWFLKFPHFKSRDLVKGRLMCIVYVQHSSDHYMLFCHMPCHNLPLVELLMSVLLLGQGHSQGGSWGACDPPFCKPFLTKQPTTGGENAMTISWL